MDEKAQLCESLNRSNPPSNKMIPTQAQDKSHDEEHKSSSHYK